MKRVWAWVAAGLLTAGCKAEGIGRLAEVSVIDRDSGISLPVTRYRGEYWVAGRPDARYAIEIVNHTAGRMMAVTSVDGLNVLSGQSAAYDQIGYVFEPDADYQISGWRKSDQQVAAFVFAAAPNSYAERTGRPANLGVIGVAVFRERERDSQVAQSMLDQQSHRSEAPAAKLGTGHGEREYSPVSHTQFTRLRSLPDEVIRIHYDSTENLVAMGIIRKPRPLPADANPFPGSPAYSYVPDPPG